MMDFVIVNYNTLELLQNLYRQLRDMHPGSSIIIVDNASEEEGTSVWLGRLSVPRVLMNDENVGYAPACNQGAAEGESEYICFLNPDVILSDGWLDGVITAFEDEQVVLAGPQQLHADGRPFRYNFVGGACMVVRRWWFEEVGGLDEALIFGWDDVDISRLAQEAGYRFEITEPPIVHLGERSRVAETRELLEVSRAHFQEKWEEVAYVYVGSGNFLVGIPKRDLTRQDVLTLLEREVIDQADDLELTRLYKKVR